MLSIIWSTATGLILSNSSNNISCIAENTAYNLSDIIKESEGCGCKTGYTGKYCENYNREIVILGLLNKIYQSATTFIILTWLGLKCYDLKRFNKCKLTLSMISMLLISVAGAIQLSYIWIPQDIIHITNENVYIIMIFAIVLVYSPTVLWLASTSLLVGFWYELLTKRLTERASAYRTRILVIINSIVMIVLAISGMIVVIADIKFVLLASVLIFLPLIVGVIITSIVSFKITRLDVKGLSNVLEEKQKIMSRIFVLVSVLWLVCVSLVFVSMGMGYTSAKPHTYIVTNIFMFLEGSIPILLMLANDWKCGSVCRIICCREPDPRSISRTMGSLETKKTAQPSINSPQPSSSDDAIVKND